MSYLESDTAPSADWNAPQQALLTRAAQHTELVDFVVLDPRRHVLAATKRAE
jgi:hypothetical protein